LEIWPAPVFGKLICDIQKAEYFQSIETVVNLLLMLLLIRALQLTQLFIFFAILISNDPENKNDTGINREEKDDLSKVDN
jgi:hypothetical protein